MSKRRSISYITIPILSTYIYIYNIIYYNTCTIISYIHRRGDRKQSISYNTIISYLETKPRGKFQARSLHNRNVKQFHFPTVHNVFLSSGVALLSPQPHAERQTERERGAHRGRIKLAFRRRKKRIFYLR